MTDKVPHCKVILFLSFQLISNLWDDLCHHLTIIFSNNISQNAFIIHWCSMPNPLLHWWFKQNEFSSLAFILPLFPGFLCKEELLVPRPLSLSLSLLLHFWDSCWTTMSQCAPTQNLASALAAGSRGRNADAWKVAPTESWSKRELQSGVDFITESGRQ